MMNDDLDYHKQLIVERILEDERLTADLDDAAATLLLNWGIATAKEISADIETISDEEAMADVRLRLRSLRAVMRYVNNWFGKRGTAVFDVNCKMIKKIGAETAVFHPNTFTPPDQTAQEQFAQQIQSSDDPIIQIPLFIDWVAKQTSGIVTPSLHVIPAKVEMDTNGRTK